MKNGLKNGKNRIKQINIKVYKKETGVTLIALIVTVIVLLILASVATYSGIESIKSSRVTLFATEMKIMQSQINKLYSEGKTFEENDGQVIQKNTEMYNQLISRLDTVSEFGYGKADEDISGYRYFTKEDLKQDLAIEGVEQSIFVNLQKRKVISQEGVEYNGKNGKEMVYVLEQLPDNLYNVDYENNVSDKPIFDVKITEVSDSEKWQVDVYNISYSGNVAKWTVYYKSAKMTNWNTSDSYTFIVTNPGKYTIKLVNNEIESDTIEITTNQPNAPKLTSDMTAVYWDENGNEITGDTSANWYNYDKNRWANAKTSDGSYWVWIPRYAYKINSGLYTSNAGEIDIKFIDTKNSDDSKIYSTTYPSVTNDAMDDYVVHPAFVDGTDNKFANGEWDKELDGIWVAKFEMSMETNGKHTDTLGNDTGMLTISDSVKAVSKPGVTAWRYSNVGNCYINSYNYDRGKDSHLIKNSEWGAVAYLAQSKYGRNGNEILVNENSSYYTGGGEGESYKTNVSQSTTGNITGIYDMSGGAEDYVAYYYNSDDVDKTRLANGSTFATPGKISDKYATSHKENLFGNALMETSSWNSDSGSVVDSGNPFMARGGRYNQGVKSGIFAKIAYYGTGAEYVCFRISLAF